MILAYCLEVIAFMCFAIWSEVDKDESESR